MQPKTVAEALNHRFMTDEFTPDAPHHAEVWQSMAARGSCRAFLPETLDPALVRMLCAVALSAPSKSDLQQRDIILLNTKESRAALADLVPDQPWITGAPHIAIFCGNNRRQRDLHDRTGIAFANDHLDAFFNAAVDGGVALSAFVTAAEAAGLGACPISGVRNQVEAVAALLGLPDHVFPVAGVGFGTPARAPRMSARLPLDVTVHDTTYSETAWPDALPAYDAYRMGNGDYPTQRYPDSFGDAEIYGWSVDKARQYSQPERAGFGAFIRRIGFRLD